MMRRWFLNSLFAATLTIGTPLSFGVGNASAGPTQEAASKFINDVVGSTIEAMSGEDLSRKEQEDRFRNLFTKYIDIAFIGRFVTGRYWRAATPADREEFLKLLEDVTVLSWSSRITTYSDFGMEILGPKPTKSRDIFIETRFNPAEGPAVNVIWRLAEVGETFTIRDMVIEGASMAITHRSEYTSVIRRSGGKLAGLNDALKKKIAQLSK